MLFIHCGLQTPVCSHIDGIGGRAILVMTISLPAFLAINSRTIVLRERFVSLTVKWLSMTV